MPSKTANPRRKSKGAAAAGKKKRTAVRISRHAAGRPRPVSHVLRKRRKPKTAAGAAGTRSHRVTASIPKLEDAGGKSRAARLQAAVMDVWRRPVFARLRARGYGEWPAQKVARFEAYHEAHVKGHPYALLVALEECRDKRASGLAAVPRWVLDKALTMLINSPNKRGREFGGYARLVTRFNQDLKACRRARAVVAARKQGSKRGSEYARALVWLKVHDSDSVQGRRGPMTLSVFRRAVKMFERDRKADPLRYVLDEGLD